MNLDFKQTATSKDKKWEEVSGRQNPHLHMYHQCGLHHSLVDGYPCSWNPQTAAKLERHGCSNYLDTFASFLWIVAFWWFLFSSFPLFQKSKMVYWGRKATWNWLAVFIIDAQLMESLFASSQEFHGLLIHPSGETGQSTCYHKREIKHIYIEYFSINNIRTPWCVLKLCKQADIIKSDIKSHLNHTN